jgi:integrase
MLRSVNLSQEGFDMKNSDLNALIETWTKKVKQEHRTKQANMFTKEEVKRFIIEAPESYLGLKLILLVGIYTGLRCDTITKLDWKHIVLTSDQVKVLVDYVSKTYRGAIGMWLSFPLTADDSRLDSLLLFSKYRNLLERKKRTLTSGRLWVRIDQCKDGSYKVTE